MRGRRLLAGAAVAASLVVPAAAAHATPLQPTTVPPSYCANLPTIQDRVADFESHLDTWASHVHTLAASFTGPQHDAVVAAADALVSRINTWKTAIDARMADLNAACAPPTPTA